VSLKSRKAIDLVGPDLHDEISVTFRREPDKTYTKVTQVTCRDRKTGSIKPMKSAEPIEEGPFEVTQDSHSYDEKMEYQDIDGKTVYVYLKRVAIGSR
jgi:hypothetical protein